MRLSIDQSRDLVARHGTPLYINDLSEIHSRAKQLKRLSLPYGLTTRYAVKANPNPEIIQVLAEEGLLFDASSSYEAQALLDMGIPGSSVSLSSQQPAHNLSDLLGAGVLFIATSLHQLRLFAMTTNHPKQVGLRINPGVGSGHNNRLTTGGVGASFGLWHEYLPDALAAAEESGLTVNRLHVHVGRVVTRQSGAILLTQLSLLPKRCRTLPVLILVADSKLPIAKTTKLQTCLK